MDTETLSSYSLEKLNALRNETFTKLQKAEYQLMIRYRINADDLEDIKAITKELGQIEVELNNRENP